jgi:Cys-rich protein (TIGR01571 family)
MIVKVMCFDRSSPCRFLGLMGSFCPTCLICQNANGLGESGCMFAVLSCFVPCVALTLLRGNARARYGIGGGLCGDSAASWICGPCVNCQIANTLKHRH